jgi:hypothetical protein
MIQLVNKKDQKRNLAKRREERKRGGRDIEASISSTC